MHSSMIGRFTTSCWHQTRTTKALDRITIGSSVRVGTPHACEKFFTTTARYRSNSDSQKDNMKTISLTKISNHVAHIELQRPEVKNAVSLEMAEELIAALNSLGADQSIRCVLLSGSGPDFSSGVDLKSFMSAYQTLQDIEDIARKAKLLRNLIERFQEPFKKLYNFEKPLICVQHGLALGLSMELASCCDIRFCSRDTKMAIREVAIGIAADVGSLQLMPRLSANQSLLNELIFTGRYMTTDEAVQLGFVSHVGDTKDAVIEKATKVAESIAQKSPVAVQGSKRNLKFSLDKPLNVGLDYNAVWNSVMMQGNDVAMAIGAILSKDDGVKFEDF